MQKRVVILTAFLFAFAVCAPIYANETTVSGSGAVERKAAPPPPAKKSSSKWLFIAGGAAVVALVLVLVLTKKSKSENKEESNILVDQNVTVGGGGGSAHVTFNVNAPCKIRITLTAASSMEPYGYLEIPNGTSVYCPPNGASVNGKNIAEFDLPLSGNYGLTIFDGANQGGSVHVVIEKI